MFKYKALWLKSESFVYLMHDVSTKLPAVVKGLEVNDFLHYRSGA